MNRPVGFQLTKTSFRRRASGASKGLFLTAAVGLVLGSFSGALSAPPAIRPDNALARNASSQPAEELILNLGKNVTMKLALIPSGTFTMGSPEEEKGRLTNEGPQREVTLSKSFYMGVFEVTQAQYQAIMGTNPSKFKGATNPVEQVSWNDAVSFCKKASATTGKNVRLPTEAEWEYACRAGSKTEYSFGDSFRDLSKNDWFADNSKKSTHPVGQLKANSWGLYDMHGNVWEWCSDWSANSFAAAERKDPQGPRSGTNHVIRGGAWLGSANMCRSAFRTSSLPTMQTSYFGFRVVVPVDAK